MGQAEVAGSTSPHRLNRQHVDVRKRLQRALGRSLDIYPVQDYPRLVSLGGAGGNSIQDKILVPRPHGDDHTN